MMAFHGDRTLLPLGKLIGKSAQFVLEAQSNFGPGQLWVGRHRDDEASEALDPQNRAEPKTEKPKKTKKRTTSNNHVKSVVKSVDLIPTTEESDSNHFRIVSAFSFDMGFKSNLVHILLSIARKELKRRHGTQSIGYPSHMDCLKTCTTAAI
jgi:hypothetical protein